jgi:DNA-binding MarR family transcriptional regulator
VTHPAAELNDTIHQRVRLGILAVLKETRRADFAYLRDELHLTDGNLSQHLSVLEDGGYVEISKTIEGKKVRTWVSATKAGRSALASELRSLRALLRQTDGAAD